MALRAGLVGLAVLFLLAAGSRELGRRYYMRALTIKDGDEQDVALNAAQYWDRWNPDYSIQMAEHALARGRQSPSAIQHGLLLTDRALDDAPAHAEGYMLRSRFLRAGGQVFSALTAAEKAVFFAPRRADFRWELGGLYESVGRLDAARAEYASVLNLEPRNVDALMALARVEEKNRRYPEALEAYRRVLTLDRSRQSALIRYESLRERMEQGML
jgi:tetratricopeptide (TPR) repeat protein